MSRGLTRDRAGDLVRVLLAGGVAIVLVAGATILQVWRTGASDQRRPVDAIVVLGAAQYDGRPSPVFEARLAHAVELWHAGLAGAFVVTGGKLEGDRTTEADVARAYAIAHGVPEDAIFGEDQAHNTLDSLAAVADELEARGLRSAVFVSDPTHMLRVLRIARDLGVEAYGSPTTTSPVQADPLRATQATIHELGALAVYFLTGGAPPVEQPAR